MCTYKVKTLFMYLCFASIGVIVFTSTKKMKNSHLTIIQPQAHTKLNPALGPSMGPSKHDGLRYFVPPAPLSPALWVTQLRRAVAVLASHWRYCIRFDGLESNPRLPNFQFGYQGGIFYALRANTNVCGSDKKKSSRRLVFYASFVQM